MTNHPNRSIKSRILGRYTIVDRSHGGNMGSIPAMTGKEAVQLWLVNASSDPSMRNYTANTVRAELQGASEDWAYYQSLRALVD